MDFIINDEELEALMGLLHFQQLAYLRGIRPYMDVQTGVVGVKRGISHQSIAEQLYVEPHTGIKSSTFSRAQVRRALSALERVGLISIQSQEMKLILKCDLATKGYFVQNKPVTKPSQQPVTLKLKQCVENKEFSNKNDDKPDIGKLAKAVTPLKDNNNYIFLSKQFECFWFLYPVKKDMQKAWEVFQGLNPSDALCAQIISSLQNQLNFMQQQQARGQWVPNWKNPANWLTQQCWNDELTEEAPQEAKHAAYQPNHSNKGNADFFWDLCKEGAECETDRSNVIEFPKCGS